MYDVKMQQQDEKTIKFNKVLGRIVSKMRKDKLKTSLNKFAHEFDFDRGNLSKLENGVVNCRVATLFKISEALGLKFSEFAKILEDELGENFSFIDE